MLIFHQQLADANPLLTLDDPLLAESFMGVAADPFGEALTLRVFIRLKDGTTLDFSGDQDIISANPIKRKKSKKFGVMQGAPFSFRITNRNLALHAYDLPGCWVALQVGFPAAGQWALFAQGRIHSATSTTDGVVTINAEESLIESINFRLPRDMFFSPDPWASDIHKVQADDASGDFNNEWDTVGSSWGVEYVGTIPGIVQDETLTIEFTEATSFQVLAEDGSTIAAGLDISSDNVVGNAGFPAMEIFRIRAAGWSQEAGSYHPGDVFEFYSSAARTGMNLNPIGMVLHLATDVAQLRCLDVIGQAQYGWPFYAVGVFFNGYQATVLDKIGGFWPKGSRLGDMIQQALMLVHATLFSTASGQMGLYYLRQPQGDPWPFNGNPDGSAVNIISGSVSEDMGETYNRIILNYLSMSDGRDASVQVSDPQTDFFDERVLEVSTGWRVSKITATGFVNKALNRFKKSRRRFALETTLAAAHLNMAESITINDELLGASVENCEVEAVAVDPLSNKVNLEAWLDPVAAATYGKADISVIDGPDLIW